MKKLLIVFIILPFISIGQIKNCTIESFANYHYDWDYDKDKIQVYESDTYITKYEIYKTYFIVTYYDYNNKITSKNKIYWKHLITKENKIHVYYAEKIDFKYVINENERRIYSYYNYNKLMDAYKDVSVDIY
jgi:hypothetical protein